MEITVWNSLVSAGSSWHCSARLGIMEQAGEIGSPYYCWRGCSMLRMQNKDLKDGKTTPGWKAVL